MRRGLLWLLAVLVVAAAAFAGAGCGDDEDSGSGGQTDTSGATSTAPAPSGGLTLDELRSRDRIVFGVKFDQPLFGLKNPTNDEVEGFDVEIAKLIAQAILGEGFEDKIEFRETPSRVREASIEDGTVDMVVATYTINDTRKEVVDFAGPYYVAGQDIMVRADDDSITGVQDLNGKKVCSAVGSTSIDNVREQAPQADLSISFDRYSLCAEALADRRVDAVTTDNIILLGLIKESDGAFKLVGQPFTEEPYGIGMRKGSDELRSFVNDRLEEIYASGEWKAAFDATIGTAGETAPEPPAVDRY